MQEELFLGLDSNGHKNTNIIIALCLISFHKNEEPTTRR